MKIEIELHDKWDLPPVIKTGVGTYKQYSEAVYAIDENNDPAALMFNHDTDEWEELGGEEIGEIDFKWFYVPKSLSNV